MLKNVSKSLQQSFPLFFICFDISEKSNLFLHIFSVILTFFCFYNHRKQHTHYHIFHECSELFTLMLLKAETSKFYEHLTLTRRTIRFYFASSFLFFPRFLAPFFSRLSCKKTRKKRNCYWKEIDTFFSLTRLFCFHKKKEESQTKEAHKKRKAKTKRKKEKNCLDSFEFNLQLKFAF